MPWNMKSTTPMAERNRNWARARATGPGRRTPTGSGVDHCRRPPRDCRDATSCGKCPNSLDGIRAPSSEPRPLRLPPPCARRVGHRPPRSVPGECACASRSPLIHPICPAFCRPSCQAAGLGLLALATAGRLRLPGLLPGRRPERGRRRHAGRPRRHPRHPGAAAANFARCPRGRPGAEGGRPRDDALRGRGPGGAPGLARDAPPGGRAGGPGDGKPRPGRR